MCDAPTPVYFLGKRLILGMMAMGQICNLHIFTPLAGPNVEPRASQKDEQSYYNLYLCDICDCEAKGRSSEQYVVITCVCTSGAPCAACMAPQPSKTSPSDGLDRTAKRPPSKDEGDGVMEVGVTMALQAKGGGSRHHVPK